MNKVERVVYNLVKRNPRLKMGIRNAYQRVCDAVPVRQVECPYEIVARDGFFFGFHDKSPWSPDNAKLLGNRVLTPQRMPRPEDRLEVGYFTGQDCTQFVPVGETRAWNWQQGCMLQWVGGTDRLIFNDFDGLQHVARIYDVHGSHLRTLPSPVAAVSPDGEWALSYSFERCGTYSPGYGYANGADPEKGNEKPVTHGLQLLSLASGEKRSLFSVRDVASLQPDRSMEGAFHYLTHCQFAPSGTRFAFFHRWIKDFNVLRTRMISCDLGAEHPFVFPTDGMVSHVAWRDDRAILAYARVKRRGDRYALFEDQTDNYEVVGEAHFDSDGHPCFSPDRRWILTDTYPDRFRVSFLILYDMWADRRFNLAKLRSPRVFASPRFEDNWQCDLHPRWDRAGASVCFDSAHRGHRALCTIRLGSLVAGEPLHVD